MSRRVATIALSGILLVALVAVAFLLPVPFVTMSPGPTENTLGTVDGKPIVEISGEKTYPVDGALSLTTVAVTSPDQRLDLPSAIGAWLDPTVAVLPRSYIYSEDETPQEVEQRNEYAMNTSQQDAIAAALAVLGRPVRKDSVVVLSVNGDMPAFGKLEVGDLIREVDGKPVTEPEDVVEAVSRHRPGDDVHFVVTRNDERKKVTVTTTEAPDDPDRAMVGITPAMGYDFPIDVTIHLGQEIGGPSAGTMFALAIVERLGKESLTGGKHIAGTGTIDAEGNVGPIGGIQQKIAAAERDGAEVFLVPAGNCAEAVSAPVDDIRLVRVEKLSDAVASLRALADGEQNVPGCER